MIIVTLRPALVSFACVYPETAERIAAAEGVTGAEVRSTSEPGRGKAWERGVREGARACTLFIPAFVHQFLPHAAP